MDAPHDKDRGTIDNITVGTYALCTTDKVLTMQGWLCSRGSQDGNHAPRVKWYNVYLDTEGEETAEPTAKPSTARLDSASIL